MIETYLKNSQRQLDVLRKEKGMFTDRELNLMFDCLVYRMGKQAGLPGHNLIVIIGKLIDLLNVKENMGASNRR